MIYSAIGVMSGSSLDGLDVVHAAFLESGGKWNYEIKSANCFGFDDDMQAKLINAAGLSAWDYQLLHTEFGHFIGKKVNEFIRENALEHKIHLISSHGHTVFHSPEKKMTAQLGDGAAIAAETNLSVVSDLRNMDVALNGQGAPIVPIGEKLLMNEYDSFLNIGGIANISLKRNEKFTAFDVCPANRVLNMLANEINVPFDDGGLIASRGHVDEKLLSALNTPEYYSRQYPKSLPNSFGVEIVYPMIKNAGLTIEDNLCTYTEHICRQIFNALNDPGVKIEVSKLLVTGGGAFNHFLIERLSQYLKQISIEVVVADKELAMYKEALIMALIGVLRWREEVNVFSSVTGASKNSIGGALWMGT